MILSRSIRRQHALRVASSFKEHGVLITHNVPPRRLLHRVPSLGTHEQLYKSDGVPGLLSPANFDLAWTQYQGYLIDQLNQRVQGTQDEYASPKDLIIKHARQADKAAVFNYASMAHNNHLFFHGLSPQKTNPSRSLQSHIEESFSSLSSLRAQLLATANAMFGPGFVWLVHKNTHQRGSVTPGSLAILTTYIAGSPYPGAHARRQPMDMGTTTTGIQYTDTASDYVDRGVERNVYGVNAGLQQQAYGYAGSHGPHSANKKQIGPQGQDLNVCLAVSTWEHVWLGQYGVGGKKKFLERWWERIDWGTVETNMQESEGEAQRQRQRRTEQEGGRYRPSYF